MKEFTMKKIFGGLVAAVLLVRYVAKSVGNARLNPTRKQTNF